MAYWRLYYHLVWATAKRQPLLTPDIEAIIHAYLVEKARFQEGHCYAINGMPDHVHLIVAIPPKIAVAEFVKNLKGSSSRHMHLEHRRPFEWQAGYSVFSLSSRNITDAVAYVIHQKEHHAQGKTFPVLEQFGEFEDGPPDHFSFNPDNAEE